MYPPLRGGHLIAAELVVMQLPALGGRLSAFGNYYKRASEDVFVILKKPSYL